LLELECHDCIPPNGPGDPDYFPRITFTGDEWPVWGGPWLEQTGDRITPRWRASRAVPPFESNVDVTLQVWDQDNEPFPDDISQIDGNATFITRSLTPWDPVRRTVNLIPGYFELSSRGDQTSCSIGGDFPWIDNCSLEFDSSRIVYKIEVCKWAPEPGGVRDTNSCDFDWITDNQPPVASLQIEFSCRPSVADCTPPIGPDAGFVFEGQVVRVEAGGSSDPDAASDPIFLGNIWKYEYDCAYDPTPICLSTDDPELIGNPPVNMACEEGFDYVADGFVPYRGCRNAAEFDNGPIVRLEFNPADGVCIDPATGIRERDCVGRSAFGKQMTMALRVTDGGGKSDIATAVYPVFNAPPVVTRFEIAQVPGQPTVTFKAEFTDNGLDDGLFQCRFSGFDGVIPGDIIPGKMDDPTVSVVFDPLSNWYRTFYTCEVTWENIPPGDYTAFVDIQDKDFGQAAFNTGVPFSVYGPILVVDPGDGSVLSSIIAEAEPGRLITFDPSLSGQTITLTQGTLAINKALTIDASNLPDGITISGDTNNNGVPDAGDVRVFNIGGNANVVLKGITVTGGYGGCISNSGDLELIDSTVSGCTTSSFGGGIYNSGGRLILTRSTVSDNQAGFYGGGIANFSLATLTLINSTVSGNQADFGGGIFSSNQTTIVHSTVSNNRADISGGGMSYAGAGADLMIENSIIAGNMAGSDPDFYMETGLPTLSGVNLIGSHDTLEPSLPLGHGQLIGTLTAPLDPRLNPLGDYTGPTPTMPPFADSPAVDAALLITATSPATDQRGIPRPIGTANDIGSVERFVLDPADTDGDGVPDPMDNCSMVPNASQRDSNNDGFGNDCDPDFDGNLIVNAADLAFFKTKFFSSDPDADLNGNGVVNAADLAILKSMFFRAPGPSGLVP
jgi:hypothetical protein